MYKLISSLFMIAFVALASAFSTPQQTVSNDAPELMITVDLSQTGPGQATGTWTATSNGPFEVTLTNLNTGQRSNFSTSQTTWVFNGLISGNTYRLTVGDINLMFDDEFIK